MAAVLGLQAKIYMREIGSSVWAELGNAKSVTLNLEKGEADVTTRNNNGWRATIGTLKDGSVEFQMVWDTEDTLFQQISDAYFADESLEFAVMSGEITNAQAQGLKAQMSILNFSRSEELEEALMVDVSIKPTYSTDSPPEWIVGGSPESA